MKLKILISLAFLLSYLCGFGQSPFFEPGEITMKDGTIRTGFVEKNTKKKMDQGIMFIESIQSDPVYYSHDKITSYRFSNYDEEYRSIEVKISQGVGDSAKWITKQKFSRILIDGDITLLRVFLNKGEYNRDVVGNKDYFYVLIKDGQKYQIDQQEAVTFGIISQVSYAFREKMSVIFSNCPEVVQLITKMEFIDSDFVEVIEAYQDCKDLEVNYYELKASPSTIYNHHFGGGILITSGEEYRTQASFSVGYAGEFRFPALSPNMGITFSGEFASYSYEYRSIPVRKFLFKQRTQLGRYFVETPNFSVQLYSGILWQSILTAPRNLDETPFLKVDFAAKVRIKEATLVINHEIGRAIGGVTSFQAFLKLGSTKKRKSN